MNVSFEQIASSNRAPQLSGKISKSTSFCNFRAGVGFVVKSFEVSFLLEVCERYFFFCE